MSAHSQKDRAEATHRQLLTKRDSVEKSGQEKDKSCRDYHEKMKKKFLEKKAGGNDREC